MILGVLLEGEAQSRNAPSISQNDSPSLFISKTETETRSESMKIGDIELAVSIKSKEGSATPQSSWKRIVNRIRYGNEIVATTNACHIIK